MRSARDHLLLRPLARSQHVKKNIHYDFDLALKVLDDHRIAFDPNDKVVGAEIMRFGNWLRNDFKKVVSLLASEQRSTTDKIFLDIGANIGTQTVYALVQNDFARAVSIEPYHRNLLALQTNVAINNLTDRVTIVPNAAGSAAGKMRLSIDEQNSGAHSLHAAVSTGRTAYVEIDTVTIDGVLASRSIDPQDIGLVWIDVEGFEAEVLQGATKLVAARTPLFIEVNAFNSAESKTGMIRSLASAGYSTAYAVGRPGRADRKFAMDGIPPDYIDGDFLFL
jgi:FkbM family methyltransferase